MNRISFLVFFATATLNCSAQSICDSLKLLKQHYYGFKPTSLNDEQKKSKSAQMDKFWNLAINNRKEAGPCISEMIFAEKNDPYFCFDAASLLLRVDSSKYLDAVQEGLSKCDLADIQLEYYLNICFLLGQKGKDISALTEKLISYPDARVYLHIHVITLSAIDASIFLYNAMGTERAEQSLIKAIREGNSTAKHNAAVVLDLLSTAKGDSLINSLLAGKQLADSTQRFIQSDRKSFVLQDPCTGTQSREAILNRLREFPSANIEEYHGFAGDDELVCSAYNNLKPIDAGIIRTARQRSIRGISDESLSEYFALTKLLMTLRYKPK